jgi:hypothetical protein
LEAEVEVFWLRGKRLNKPGVTGKREFGLLESQGLEEGAEPGVEQVLRIAWGVHGQLKKTAGMDEPGFRDGGLHQLDKRGQR